MILWMMRLRRIKTFFEADKKIDIGVNVNRKGSYNSFIGHDWVHLNSNFHDSSQSVPTRLSIDRNVSVDGPIAEKQSS
jgi:hypothetical protein